MVHLFPGPDPAYLLGRNIKADCPKIHLVESVNTGKDEEQTGTFRTSSTQPTKSATQQVQN